MEGKYSLRVKYTPKRSSWITCMILKGKNRLKRRLFPPTKDTSRFEREVTTFRRNGGMGPTVFKSTKLLHEFDKKKGAFELDSKEEETKGLRNT